MELVSAYLEEMEIKKNVRTLSTEDEAVIAYADEGERFQYMYCSMEDAKQKVAHWRRTGELAIKETDMQSGMMYIGKKKPTRVMLLNVEARYSRVIPF